MLKESGASENQPGGCADEEQIAYIINNSDNMKINWEKEGIIGFYLYFCLVIQNSNYFFWQLKDKLL